MEEKVTVSKITLTESDEQILICLADGMSTDEIADELFISRNSMWNIVSRLLQTMGAKNRTHAVALGYHYGILIPMRSDKDDGHLVT